VELGLEKREAGGSSMDGEQLMSVEQISILSGLSPRKVNLALSRGDLKDRSFNAVGVWLNSLIEVKMSKPQKRVGIRINRDPVVHRKWD
jgi:hypothetical protein